MAGDPPIDGAVPLRRRLGLALLVLYGTGITVGAGIYVLIGAVAGHAGVYAPWSFVLAATVMALTVASYAELSTCYPVSAGEAAYVRTAFRSRRVRERCREGSLGRTDQKQGYLRRSWPI
jgi:basic amino acid/polyamine antiporter, APA family